MAVRSIPRRSGFTLLELLVVIVIIAVMLVAAIPAVTSLSKASGQKASVSTVMNLLEQARALAVTSGSSTYVVFADQSTPDPYRCKALIVFKEDTNFAPAAVSKWTFLSTGISFVPAQGLLKLQNGPPQVKFLCPGALGAQPLPLPFVKFDANGMVTIPSDPNILFASLFTGSVDSSGGVTYTDNKQKVSQKFDSVVITRFTGRAHYVDPYSG